uniref:RNA helicase n=1 Tax=Scophthalmus maximus TaxID=52904 RepID=A0A8D3CJ56_SCOMX
MPSLRDSLESGLDFIEFLGERKSLTSKLQLRDIFNSEFREGIKDPTFSKVVYALRRFDRVSTRRGEIHIDVRPQVGHALMSPTDTYGSGRPIPESPAAPSSVASTPVAPVLTPKKKLATEILHKLKVNRKSLTADKGGIEITSDPVASDGAVQLTVDRLRELFVVRFHIVNNGSESIHFTYYTALHRIRCFTLVDERRVNRVCPLFLCAGESYEVVVRYTLNHYGYFPATMYFEFCPEQPGSKPFCIVREMVAAARTPLAMELGPVAPYKPFQVVTYKSVKTMIVEGMPPENRVVQTQKTIVKLGDYKYPRYLKELAKQRMEDSEYLSPTAREKLPSVKSLFKCTLNMKDYGRRLHLLLHLEEIQMEVDIRKYDLRDQTMTPDQSNKKLLALRVPGVAENRPSVLRGDCLRVSKSEDTVEPITVYNGYVHRVELDSVKLGFAKRLLQTFISNMKFDVEFTINRFSLKLQHRAVDLATKHELKDVLFPSGAAVTDRPMPQLRMFNQQLENNAEQKAAVRCIVAGSSKPAPHLVFGPPGTGKTVTLVEAMNQVSRADPSAHILACAPSNSACDLLCERLMVHMDPHQVYRMYASSRDPRSVPKQLLKYCNLDLAQDGFVFPEKEILMKHTIIVTTMITAGRLVSGGIPVGHFTHVFVDEGGQAVEPECIIAIAGLLHPEKGQLVLAGDPKQLGPIVRSRLALQNGLGETREDYVTLVACQEQKIRRLLTLTSLQGFPVIFHGVMGKDEREANSPSFFNVSEIEVLVGYLTKLVETQGKKGLPTLAAKDIGIIAPYRKQVEKIQKALRSLSALSRWSDIKELKVGCVEEFQGQERKIIMISTVRSSINYVKMDKDFNIGFLSNEKRFNVAVTRARSLLIIVGNPVILNKDSTWEKFISYCVKEKGYAGFDIDDAEGEDDVVLRLATLKISVDDETEESALQQHVDPDWKNEH